MKIPLHLRKMRWRRTNTIFTNAVAAVPTTRSHRRTALTAENSPSGEDRSTARQEHDNGIRYHRLSPLIRGRQVLLQRCLELASTRALLLRDRAGYHQALPGVAYERRRRPRCRSGSRPGGPARRRGTCGLHRATRASPRVRTRDDADKAVLALRRDRHTKTAERTRYRGGQ